MYALQKGLEGGGYMYGDGDISIIGDGDGDDA